MARPKKPEIEFEIEDAADVPEDTVFLLDMDGEVQRMEVDDDVGDDQA